MESVIKLINIYESGTWFFLSKKPQLGIYKLNVNNIAGCSTHALVREMCFSDLNNSTK